MFVGSKVILYGLKTLFNLLNIQGWYVILDIAKFNGFKERTVKKKIRKFKRMKSIHETSTLSSESPEKTYMRMTY